MITIYHLGNSQSDRIVWLMEELGLEYELEWFDRDPNLLAPAEYLALHPTATAPVIKDGDTVLTESNAIVEYICQRHGQGQFMVSPKQPNYPDFLYWMQYNNNLMTMFLTKLAQDGSELKSDMAKLINELQHRRSERYYQHLNTHLGTSDYLAGDEFTAADIMILFVLTSGPAFGARTIDDLPNVTAYVARISERPAYQKAMAIAGPEAQRPTN